MTELFLNVSELEAKEMFPGATARILHARHITIIYWDFEAGVRVPQHSHVNEQVLNVMEGTFELTVDGSMKRMEAGFAAVIPSDAPHSGRAVTACRLIDVFYPAREDLK